jgi:GNAT superfamily N-acetyltransferase
MRWPHEYRVGRSYLDDVTLLLQRIRAAHPTAGLYEAGDLQWWWAQRSRPTDDLAQLLWFDESGRPDAAVIITSSGGQVQFDPIVMPGATADWVGRVMECGLAHASHSGFETVCLEVDQRDAVLREILFDLGFGVEEDVLVETWLAAESRTEVSPLREGYRLSSRVDSMQRPHHMTKRNGPDVEVRLRQTSLYRADLDLVVLDRNENVAAYGLFWFDPVTSTGLVEPMRTEDDHQRRGLARHILTTGIDGLVKAGARRIKICFEPDNLASSHLYLSVGFEPDRRTGRFTGPTARRTGRASQY